MRNLKHGDKVTNITRTNKKKFYHCTSQFYFNGKIVIPEGVLSTKKIECSGSLWKFCNYTGHMKFVCSSWFSKYSKYDSVYIGWCCPSCGKIHELKNNHTLGTIVHEEIIKVQTYSEKSNYIRKYGQWYSFRKDSVPGTGHQKKGVFPKFKGLTYSSLRNAEDIQFLYEPDYKNITNYNDEVLFENLFEKENLSISFKDTKTINKFKFTWSNDLHFNSREERCWKRSKIKKQWMKNNH